MEEKFKAKGKGKGKDKAKETEIETEKDATETEKKVEMEIEDKKDLFNIYKSFKDLPSDYKGLVRASMFPDSIEKMRDVYQLNHSIRILPHDQNTSGFYLCLIRKKANVVFKFNAQDDNRIKSNEKANKEKKVPDTSADEDVIKQFEGDITYKAEDDLEEEKIPEKPEVKNQLTIPRPHREKEEKGAGYIKGKGPKEKKESYISFNSPQWEWIRDFYGFNEEVVKPLLIWQKEGDKRVLLVTEGVTKLLKHDTKGVVNKINMGTKLLERNKEQFMDNICPYRVCQDGVLTVLPYMTKRKIKCPAIDFKFFITKSSHKYSEIPNEELREEIEALGQGACVLYAEKDGDIQTLDCLACLNFKTSITIMASKELIESFKIRYCLSLSA